MATSLSPDTPYLFFAWSLFCGVGWMLKIKNKEYFMWKCNFFYSPFFLSLLLSLKVFHLAIPFRVVIAFEGEHFTGIFFFGADFKSTENKNWRRNSHERNKASREIILFCVSQFTFCYIVKSLILGSKKMGVGWAARCAIYFTIALYNFTFCFSRINFAFYTKWRWADM